MQYHRVPSRSVSRYTVPTPQRGQARGLLINRARPLRTGIDGPGNSPGRRYASYGYMYTSRAYGLRSPRLPAATAALATTTTAAAV